MYKILITTMVTRPEAASVHSVVVEFELPHLARQAIEKINDAPKILEGWAGQYAQALF